MWARAVAAGMSSAEFWSLTSEELGLFFEAVRERQRRVDLLFGLIAAQVENWSPRRGPGRARRPADFFRTGTVVTEEFLRRWAERPLVRTGRSS